MCVHVSLEGNHFEHPPTLCLGSPAYLDVDRLPGASGSHEEAGLLVSDKEVHEVGVAHRVHRGNNDGVELGVLWDGGHVAYSLRPQLPPGIESIDQVITF